MRKTAGKAYDLKVDGKFLYSSIDIVEVYEFWKKFAKGGNWKRVGERAEWQRTVPASIHGGDIPQFAFINERSWTVEVPELKGYKSNKSMRREIDKRLDKIAALNAQVGTKQQPDKIINKKIAELSKEILNIDPNFLTIDND